ncbi:MEDS domain-containing protein [Planotetraspora phitsanulokensis]|nr:MEDS domain-containing protein [Planotetraspora phitsanulokensis]
MGPGEHRSVAFSDEAELEPVLAPFVSEGLAGRDKVLYITDVTHPAVAVGLLRGWGIDPDAHAGRLEVRALGTSDPDVMVAELTEAAHRARAEGYRALRFTGEMSWAVREGTETLTAFETQVQAVFDSGLAMGVCQYDRRVFPPVTLSELQRLHTGTDVDLEFDGALLRIRRSARPPGLDLDGEIDANGVGELARALSSAVRRERGDVHVDMGRISFIDLSGLRVLVDTATALAEGRSLVLNRVPEHVVQLIRLIGWDRAPGLRVRGGGARWSP